MAFPTGPTFCRQGSTLSRQLRQRLAGRWQRFDESYLMLLFRVSDDPMAGRDFPTGRQPKPPKKMGCLSWKYPEIHKA